VRRNAGGPFERPRKVAARQSALVRDLCDRGIVGQIDIDEVAGALQLSRRQPAAAKRRNLTLAKLMDEPWVLAQPGSLARSLQDQTFRNSGFEPPFATVQTVSLHLYMRLIETGRWLGLIPGSALRFGGKDMRIKALSVQTSMPPAPVGIITAKDRTLTPLAEKFIACTRKVAGLDLGRTAALRN
jgi:DNA-binding transcriptional LysR family regulator